MTLKPRSEAEIQKAILAYLATRGDVLAIRTNSGAVSVPAADTTARRFVRFGFVGCRCPYILGAIRRRYLTAPSSGNSFSISKLVDVPVLFAFEVKTVKAWGTFPRTPTERAQAAFIERVRAWGGIAKVVCDVESVARALRP